MSDNVLDPTSMPSSKVIDIRKYSNTQLLALVKQPEKCAARLAVQPLPLTKEALYHHTPAATYTMGGVGQDNRYYRAWSNIVKNNRPASFDVAPAPTAVQPGAAAPAPAAGASRHVRAFLPPTPEQLHFNTLLGDFLGRTVKPPYLAPNARPLDLRRLYLEVMVRGGEAAVCSSEWHDVAGQLLSSADLGPDLAAAYRYHLSPLEAAVPPGLRPARVMDWLEPRARERVAVKDVVLTAAAVQGAVNVTRAALKRVAAAPPSGSDAASDAAAGAESLAPRALAAVRAAATDPADAAAFPGLLFVDTEPGTGDLSGAGSAPAEGAEKQQLPGEGRGSRGSSEQGDDEAEEAVERLAKRPRLAGDEGSGGAGQRGMAEAGSTTLRGEAGGGVVGEKIVDVGAQLGRGAGAAGVAADADDEPASSSVKEGQQVDGDADRPLSSLHTARRQPPLEAALLLSFLACRAAPPGWDLKQPPPPAARAAASQAGQSSAHSFPHALKAGKLAMLSSSRVGKVVSTPKCTACKTCLNPQLKKACMVNRQRIADGLPPIVP